MSNKKNNTPECIIHLETLLSILKADNKEPEWYEREPFRETLCWVSNVNKIPTKGDIIKLIIGYQEGLKCPFRITDGYSGNYKYAVPMPTNALLEYSLEYQMKQNK